MVIKVLKISQLLQGALLTYLCSQRFIADSVHIKLTSNTCHRLHWNFSSQDMQCRAGNGQYHITQCVLPTVNLIFLFSSKMWCCQFNCHPYFADVIIYTDSGVVTSLSIISSSVLPGTEVGAKEFSLSTFLFQLVSVSPLSHDHCCAESTLYQN